jgi:hypothetical protein
MLHGVLFLLSLSLSGAPSWVLIFGVLHLILKLHRVHCSVSCPCQVLNTLKLENEMIGRQAKGAVAQKEKAMVDHDVMKLVGDCSGWMDRLKLHQRDCKSHKHGVGEVGGWRTSIKVQEWW